MKIISIAELKANFDEYLQQSEGEPILLTENGQAIAAINLIVDADELERFLLAHNLKFNQIMEQSRRSLKEEGGLKSEDFWQLVDESSTQESEKD